MKIYRANIIYTQQSDRFEIIPHGYIAVEKGKVEGVYPEMPGHLQQCEVEDLGDRLLIPAMNDMHVHAPQYRNQGIAMDLELMPWLEKYTFPEEQKYADTAYAERMYRRFVRDLWRYGTMRVVAFATVHLDSTRLLMRLLEKAGMAGLCTQELMTACGEMVRKYNLPVQSHLSENHDEIEFVKQLEPESRFYGDAYDRYGLFGKTPTVMAHCVWTGEEELQLIKERRVMVAHCPTSNLNVSSGMAPIRRFLNADVSVGLGSDVSGGHDFSIFRMMVYAIQVSKMHYCNDKSCAFLTLPEVFWIATKSAGSFFGKVGSFEPGYDFDALVIDDTELNFDNYTLPQRLERFIYIGDDRQIVARYCQGRLISDPGA